MDINAAESTSRPDDSCGQVGVRLPAPSLLRGGGKGDSYGGGGGGGVKSQVRMEAAGSPSTVPGSLPRRRRRCCARGRSGAARVSARPGPGAALSSGGSGSSRGERRLAAGAGAGCCAWDPAWKSEKDTPSTTAGSQMKTSALL